MKNKTLSIIFLISILFIYPSTVKGEDSPAQVINPATSNQEDLINQTKEKESANQPKTVFTSNDKLDVPTGYVKAVPKAGILPNSIFYRFKLLYEKFLLVFPLNRSHRILVNSNTRLKEICVLHNTGNFQFTKQLLDLYDGSLPNISFDKIKSNTDQAVVQQNISLLSQLQSDNENTRKFIHDLLAKTSLLRFIQASGLADNQDSSKTELPKQIKIQGKIVKITGTIVSVNSDRDYSFIVRPNVVYSKDSNNLSMSQLQVGKSVSVYFDDQTPNVTEVMSGQTNTNEDQNSHAIAQAPMGQTSFILANKIILND